MRSLKLLSSLVGCPLCGHDVEAVGDEASSALACTACRQSFPCWGGLPWLFDRPQEYRVEWGQRLRFYLQTLDSEIQYMKVEQRLPDLLPPTAERLRTLIQAKTEQLRELDSLLKDLKLPEDPSFELNTFSGTALPENLSLLGYYANALRDWGWGEAENAATLAAVERVVGEQGSLGLMAVLGSGPSRLAYDLHRAHPGTTTLAVDINPFYLLLAARMLAGKTLQLYDFPMAPRDLKSVAVKVRCRAPEPLKENFHFLLADALKPCFKAASLDTIFTPWLIDVIPDDFRSYALRMNQWLKPGGRWINFGSLVFHQPLQSQCYSREEVEYILRESGFELSAKDESELPYLTVDHNCQKRYEKIFAFSARKIREGAAVKPYENQVSWLKNPAELLPAWEELPQQILFSHTLAVILAQINGERSMNDLSELLGPQLGLSAEDALPLLKRVIGRSYAQRKRSKSF